MKKRWKYNTISSPEPPLLLLEIYDVWHHCIRKPAFSSFRGHKNEKPAFSKISTLESIIEKMHFRWPFLPETCGWGLKSKVKSSHQLLVQVVWPNFFNWSSMYVQVHNWGFWQFTFHRVHFNHDSQNSFSVHHNSWTPKRLELAPLF